MPSQAQAQCSQPTPLRSPVVTSLEVRGVGLLLVGLRDNLDTRKRYSETNLLDLSAKQFRIYNSSVLYGEISTPVVYDTQGA